MGTQIYVLSDIDIGVEILLKRMQGGVRIVALSLVLMNRLNKPSLLFSYIVGSLYF